MAKVNRRKTVQDAERMKEIRDRLDTVIEEARRLRGEIESLHHRDETAELRKLLRRQAGRRPYRLTYNPDDPDRVN